MKGGFVCATVKVSCREFLWNFERILRISMGFSLMEAPGIKRGALSGFFDILTVNFKFHLGDAGI